MREVLAKPGLPKKLVSDNGPRFRSEEFVEFCKINGIELVFSLLSYLPATNRSAKNVVKPFKTCL